MAARSIIEAERRENLEAFEGTFSKLEGVTNGHVTALRRASTTTASRSYYPLSDDPLGQAAYTAVALRAGLRRPWPGCRETRRSRQRPRSRCAPLEESARSSDPRVRESRRLTCGGVLHPSRDERFDRPLRITG
jgi:hypothetical protein